MGKSSRRFCTLVAGFVLIVTLSCQFNGLNTVSNRNQIFEPSNSPQIETTTKIPTKTKTPKNTPWPKISTPNTIKTGTAAAKARNSYLESLYEKKLINSKDGIYHLLENLDESWAQLQWYSRWDTEINASNFVIRADVNWDSASKTANWQDSGCGFTYNEKDDDSHHFSYLGMDGYVYSARAEYGQHTNLPKGYYGKLKIPSDDARLTLIVEDHWVTFLVNDKKTVHFDDAKLTGGKISLSLFSGTNKYYGTHCSFKNIDLWELP